MHSTRGGELRINVARESLNPKNITAARVYLWNGPAITKKGVRVDRVAEWRIWKGGSTGTRRILLLTADGVLKQLDGVLCTQNGRTHTLKADPAKVRKRGGKRRVLRAPAALKGNQKKEDLNYKSQN